MTLPNITNKQQEILLHLYQFRFLNRRHIQRLLNHKDYKTINIWLRNLTEKEYLIRIYDPHTFGENTKLAVYYLGINGIRFLRTQGQCSLVVIRKLYRDKDRSENFINRCFLLADATLTLRNKSIDGVIYSATTESDYSNNASSFHFLCELNPALIFIKQKHTRMKYYLVEVLEPTLPRYSIRKRMRTYVDFYFSNDWENTMNNKPFPIILVICPTKALMIATKRYTKKLLEENQQPEYLHISFTTTDEVTKHGITGKIWEEVEL